MIILGICLAILLYFSCKENNSKLNESITWNDFFIGGVTTVFILEILLALFN